MKIELTKLEIKNFKGLSEFEFHFDGRSAIWSGKNETRKTTLKDAFTWLFFGKDSQGKQASGKSHFGLRPHDKKGNLINGLVTRVSAGMTFDGQEHEFTKENIEKVVKGEVTGYMDLCYIDGAEKSITEFKMKVRQYIDEDKFRLLSDVFYFNGEMDYRDRREVLAGFAGEIRPDGFDDFLERVGDRSVSDYKNSLTIELKGTKGQQGYEAQLKEIPAREDEVRGNMKVPEGDMTETEKKRNELKAEVRHLMEDRQALYGKETQRQKQIEKINNLKGNLAAREVELKSDTSAVDDLIKEKQGIQAIENESDKKMDELSDIAVAKNNEIKAQKDGIGTLQTAIDSARETLKDVQEAKVLTKCYACGQKLPKDKIDENKEKRTETINELKAKGRELMEDLEKANKHLDSLESEKKEIDEKYQTALEGYELDIQSKEKRFAEINLAIANRPTPDPAKDKKWQNIKKQIETEEKALGKPVSEQLDDIETARIQKQSEIDNLNEVLNQKDAFEAAKKRLIELNNQRKILAQKIADVTKELDVIKQYNNAYCRIVEDKVNSMFKHTKFKMFEIQLNGDIDDRVCEAIDAKDGTAWTDMSTGQEIFIGMDCRNTLSEIYGINTPMWIDHYESYTGDIYVDTQTIGLKAVEGQDKLMVELL